MPKRAQTARRRLLTAEAKYLVTPRGGRIGKARQVQPFEIVGGSRHGDFDAIEDEIEKCVRRYLKTTGELVVDLQTTPVAGLHAAYITVNNQLVGTLDVAAIEKDS